LTRALASRLLWDGGGLIAVDKPAGLASTGRDLDDPDCLQWLLSAHLRRPVWAVHQLDKPTSGVNLFVRRRSLVAEWQRKLAHAQKTYLALCHGLPERDRLEIDAPIGGRQTPEGWRLMVLEAGAEGARPARSRVRVLRRGPAHSLLEVAIATGRTHQVRLHLAHLGHPLVGEQRYKDPPCELAPSPFLHAGGVRFGRDVVPPELAAEPPPSFRAMAERLGLGMD
jgi:23S rRNA pseudouridine955/2504/2580 synthase